MKSCKTKYKLIKLSFTAAKIYLISPAWSTVWPGMYVWYYQHCIMRLNGITVGGNYASDKTDILLFWLAEFGQCPHQTHPRPQTRNYTHQYATTIFSQRSHQILKSVERQRSNLGKNRRSNLKLRFWDVIFPFSKCVIKAPILITAPPAQRRRIQ